MLTGQGNIQTRHLRFSQLYYCIISSSRTLRLVDWKLAKHCQKSTFLALRDLRDEGTTILRNGSIEFTQQHSVTSQKTWIFNIQIYCRQAVTTQSELKLEVWSPTIFGPASSPQSGILSFPWWRRQRRSPKQYSQLRADNSDLLRMSYNTYKGSTWPKTGTFRWSRE